VVIIAEYAEDVGRMKNFLEKGTAIISAKNVLESQKPKLTLSIKLRKYFHF